MSTSQPPSASPPLSNQAQWNGTTGAVQAVNTDGANAPDTNTSGKDAIREGKQRAKDIVTVETSNGQDGMSNGSAQSNGRQLSRKRSRDGSQKPISQTLANGNGSGGAGPSHDEILLDRYIQRDMLYGSAMNDQADRSRRLVKHKEMEKEFYLNEVKQQRHVNPGSIFGPGFQGYGNGVTDDRAHAKYNIPIKYNTMRGPPKGRRSRGLYIPRKDNSQQAEQHEELVPVRLDIELDKLRLRDTFTWNLHEKLISQDMFTEYLLEDLKVPQESLHEVARQVKQEMQDQIHNFYPHIIVEDGPLEPSRPYNEHKDDEMRVLIKLHITIGRISLIDQFEWDINNPLNSPEEFARQMAWENALSGEFTTAIAHSIREQSQQYTKSLYLTNHCFDGRPVEDPDLKESFFAPPTHSVFRPHQAQKDWMPYMYEMSEAELERTETSMMREHRAQKRQLNRRGGPALPDLKEKPRTVRSLIVHSVIPGAVADFETTGIPKARRSGRGGRRGGNRIDGDVDSEELDSDESGAESPAPSMMNVGTARTRGMRGAASAAQAAMRANFGTPRPETPDLPPTESRPSTRRAGLTEQSAADEDTLIVKLKIGKARLKAFWDDYKAKKRASEYPLSGYASQPPPAAPKATPNPPRSAPPARNTPQANGHSRATSSAPQTTYDAQGRVDTDHWPHSDEEPPPPPPWMEEAMQTLHKEFVGHEFEPLMRPYTVNASTGDIEKMHLEAGATPPAGVKVQYLPRIRCLDCVGKLYTGIPGRVVQDFQVHLRNRIHRERVESRLQQGG